MFDHHVRSDRLELWSDRPLDQAAAKRVMAAVIARPGAGDMQTLLTAWQTDDVSMNPARSGLYDRYRLQVLLAMQKRGATPAELLTSGMTREQARAVLPQRN